MLMNSFVLSGNLIDLFNQYNLKNIVNMVLFEHSH